MVLRSSSIQSWFSKSSIQPINFFQGEEIILGVGAKKNHQNEINYFCGYILRIFIDKKTLKLPTREC
jgi:hypothetical protein